MREAKRQIDANAYMHEQWQWTNSSLHHEFLFQQMFQHAKATSQSENECAICCGQRESECDLSAEPTSMELIGPDSMHQDINELYWDIYQLCRLPRLGRCEEVTKEQVHRNFRLNKGAPQA